MFWVDGIQWPIPCDIQRTAEITPSEISGLMLDKSYFNDVLGTYMKYTITLAIPFNMRDQYNTIYEAITNPVDGHTFVLPYNDSTISLTARVTDIIDNYVRLPGGGVYWKGITFNVIANHPSKTMTLGEMTVAGRTALPDVSDPDIGDSYTYTAGGWVPSMVYDDADDNYY